MGIVDRVVTPEEINLDYLQQETVNISQNEELMNAIVQAEESMTVIPEDIELEFPLGTNDPIEIGQIPNDKGTPDAANRTQAIGFVDRNEKAMSFYSTLLRNMFEEEGNNGGYLKSTTKLQKILVADANGSFLQARRIPVIDLIVRTPRGRIFLVPRVNANALCRDALNSVFNQTLRRRT